MTDAANLKQSQRAFCLHWLVSARCDDPLCTLNEATQPWLDGLNGWTRDGNPDRMYAYPSGLTLFMMQDIVRYCFALGLTVTVLPEEQDELRLEFRRHHAGQTELPSNS